MEIYAILLSGALIFKYFIYEQRVSLFDKIV